MIQFLLDTDHFTLLEYGDPKVVQALLARPFGTVGISIITVEEALRGRLAMVSKAKNGDERTRRYQLLGTTVTYLNQFPIVPFDESAELHFQKLKSAKLKIGTQDLKLSAITLARGFTLVSRNNKDFAKVPDLLLNDWSK